MAELTGNKQISIYYRVSQASGEPLDINDTPVSVSGKKQAIFLLEGTNNPNPELFEVKGYFAARAIVSGEPSYFPAPEACPEGQRVPWVLDGGVWNMDHIWINSETWNYL